MEEETTSLRFRIGAIFFMVISLFLGFLAFNIQEIGGTVIFIVLAITYFFGGATALFGNYRNGMKAIYLVNALSFIIFLGFFSYFAWSYFNHPCYINPTSCDDQLTDTQLYLKVWGLWIAVFALITFISWRLKRPSTTPELDKTDE